MHKLDRTSVEAPPCLANYRHGENTWDDVKDDKAQIHVQLERLQGRRCAYCEGSLDDLGQHIDHLRQRRAFPKLTFQWPNLYWSCLADDSCGRYKDHEAGPYEHDDLIDPCVDDPDRFFRFRADGGIEVRSGLSARDQHRAKETLRVFNLNPQFGRLRKMRKSAVDGFVYLVDGCDDYSVSELGDIFEAELAATAHLPFFTVVRHVLTGI